jgi:hypothetical protein
VLSVHHHQLGSISAAKRVGRCLTGAALGTDLACIEPQRGARRACRAIEPIWDELVRVVGAEAAVRRVPSTASRADHARRKWSGSSSFHQLGAISNAEPALGGVLAQTDRAAPRDRRRRSTWGRCGQCAALPVSGKAAGTRGHLVAPLPQGEHRPGKGEKGHGDEGPRHLQIVQDRRRGGPQKSPGVTARAPRRVALQRSGRLKASSRPR